ncbi:MAG TPA: DUF2235 domain-containing protein [Candidatus Polarisedimenticolia bacterium]|nr:DUF2235 domain-containing protein [Candidatus Polarisedimenticolia bacterium]
MSKNIVLCCDGTGNGFDNPEKDSNVVKLYNTLAIGPKQIAYYHPGVGTMGAPSARNRLEREWTRVKGLGFGSGLLDNCADAYRYLMNRYEQGDRIFLFGFSRGAYTARVIGGLLHVFGLLEAGNDGLIRYILRLYAKRTKEAKRGTPTFRAEDNFKYAFSREVKVHFCGLWDTVSSYGWINSPVELPFAGQNPVIETGRHAICIHEHRCCFQSNLWGDPLPGQDIRQVWFSGVHSDVGGSYLEREAGLSKVAFEWMLVEAQTAELEIDGERAEVVLGCSPPPVDFLPHYVRPKANDRLHESLKKAWWLLEYFPRYDPRTHGTNWQFPRGKWYRQIPGKSLIHKSVFDGGYATQRLPSEYSTEPWVPFTRKNRGEPLE